MKKILLLPVLMYIVSNVSAQLTITPGAQLVLTGNTQLTLSNIDFVNNGSFTAGTGLVLFNGNVVNRITGSQNTTLYDVTIGKTAGSLQLQVPISVSHQVVFTAGLIDLNGNDLNLGNTGSLSGEQEASHIIGPNGGTVIFNAVLNAPAAANPGNLGMIITSSQNLGNTIIKRGHQSQTNVAGTGNSILRYYDISPSNNTGLNATVRFPYLNAELNGFDENLLVFWEQQPAPAWRAVGFDTRNAGSNYVEKLAVNSFSRVTLSSVNNALPVHFILFNATCNGNAALLTWKTAQEQNASHYTVERSGDGVQWVAIGNIPAAGNSNTENDYSYTDNTAAANYYYRIAEYDFDGRFQLTKVLKTNCSNRETFSIWPNPVMDILFIDISAASVSNATVKIFDSKGALIKEQNAKLQQGNNLLSIDVKTIAAGLYFTAVSYGNGNIQTKKIMKQ